MSEIGLGKPPECIFCNRAAEKKLAALPVCLHCNWTYATIEAALSHGSTVLFICKSCDFRCDVPGVVKWERVDDTLKPMVAVDSQHNYCQNCGASSKPGKQ